MRPVLLCCLSLIQSLMSTAVCGGRGQNGQSDPDNMHLARARNDMVQHKHTPGGSYVGRALSTHVRAFSLTSFHSHPWFFSGVQRFPEDVPCGSGTCSPAVPAMWRVNTEYRPRSIFGLLFIGDIHGSVSCRVARCDPWYLPVGGRLRSS